jgi:hypothetical protein
MLRMAEKARLQTLLDREFGGSLTQGEAQELALLKATVARTEQPALQALRAESAKWHAEMDAARSELVQLKRSHAAHRSKTKSTGSR